MTRRGPKTKYINKMGRSIRISFPPEIHKFIENEATTTGSSTTDYARVLLLRSLFGPKDLPGAAEPSEVENDKRNSN